MNRDPSGASLYPGQATTELCPTTTFDGEPLYRFGDPDEASITQRLNLYHRPYHDTLAAELDRLKAAHGREIGRASCRERVSQYGWISVVAGSVKKQSSVRSADAATHRNNQ